MQAISWARAAGFLFLALVSVALIGYYFPFLAGDRTFYLSDFVYYFEPGTKFIEGALKAGRLPSWNPYLYCGMSQIAVPSPGIFYPFTWLHVLFPFSQTVAITLVFHQVICGLGGFLLVYAFGWGILAAFTTGIILALNHYLFSLQSNYSLVCTAAWLPFVLWCVYEVGNPSIKSMRQFFKSNNWCIYMLSIFAAAMFITAGRPEISLAGCLLVGVFALYSSWAQFSGEFAGSTKSGGNANSLESGEGSISSAEAGASTKFSGKAIGVYIWRTFVKLSPFIFAALLALPTILPAYEWMRLSPRATGLRAEEVLTWSTNWYEIISFYLEYPLGDLSMGGSRFLSIAGARPGFIPYVSSSYIGPIAITLAFWGFLDNTWRGRNLFLLTLLAILVLALGSNTPVAPYLVNTFPVCAIFRYPVKLLFFIVIILAIAAGRGSSQAIRSRIPAMSEFLVMCFWLVNLLLSSAFIIPGVREWALSQSYVLFHAHNLATEQVWQDAMYFLSAATLRASMVGFSLCAIAYLTWRQKFKRSIFAVVLLLELVVTLYFSATAYTSHGTEPGFYNYPCAMAQELRSFYKNAPAAEVQVKGAKLEPRFLNFYFDPLTCPSGWLQDKKGEAYTAAFYQYNRQMLLPNTHMDQKLPSAYGYTMAEVAGYKTWFFKCFFRSSQVDSVSALLGKDLKEIKVSDNRLGDVGLSRFCRLTATKCALTQAHKVSKNTPLRQVPFLNPLYFTFDHEIKGLNCRLFKVKDSYPRAYLTGNWQIADAHHKVEAILSADKITDYEMQFTEPAKMAKGLYTIVEQYRDSTGAPVPIESAKESIVRADTTPRNLQSDSVVFLQDEAEHVALSVVAKTNCLLVLCDQFYPGWQAKIDGVPVTILRTNGFMRSVYLEPGSHLVEFTYDPDCLKDSLTWCLITLGVLAAISFVVLIRFVGSLE